MLSVFLNLKETLGETSGSGKHIDNGCHFYSTFQRLCYNALFPLLTHSSNSEHLNFLYSQYEEKEQDPGRWSSAEKKKIIAVYDAGSKIEGIETNPNWIKRSSVMSGLKDGSLGSGEGE